MLIKRRKYTKNGTEYTEVMVFGEEGNVIQGEYPAFVENLDTFSQLTSESYIKEPLAKGVVLSNDKIPDVKGMSRLEEAEGEEAKQIQSDIEGAEVYKPIKTKDNKEA